MDKQQPLVSRPEAYAQVLPDLTQPDAVLGLAPEALSGYTALARSDLRFTVSRYFAERWVPVFGLYPQGAAAGPRGSAGKLAGRTAWLVTGCRQLIYWENHGAQRGQHSLVRRMDFLEQETGLGRDRIAQSLNEPLCGWFLRSRARGHRYDPARQHPVRQPHQYTVRMDDPLTPADADHLARQLGACPATAQASLKRALERVRWALAQPAATLRAPDVHSRLQDPGRFMAARPLEVADLVQLAEPGLVPPDPRDPEGVELADACDQLARHVTRPDDVVGSTYYFRKHWVKRLGAGPAWAVLLLRDRCYDGDRERRDTCWLPDYAWLARRVGVDAETIGDWLGGGLKGFVNVVEQKKGRDPADPQRVSYRIRVALRDPLTGEDQARYVQTLAAQLAQGVGRDNRPAAAGVSRQSCSSGAKVSGENQPAETKVNGESWRAGAGVTGENRLAGGGSAGNPGQLKSPNDSIPPEAPKGQESQTTSSAIRAALELLSQGDDDRVDLAAVLKELGIQSPSRGRILKVRPQPMQVLAWGLYAASTPAVQSVPGLVISKLLRPDQQAAPAGFERLARVSPHQWTALALAARRRASGGASPSGLGGGPEELELFARWWKVYGKREPADLPFELGVAAADQWAAEVEEKGYGQTGVGADRSGTGPWVADYG